MGQNKIWFERDITDLRLLLKEVRYEMNKIEVDGKCVLPEAVLVSLCELVK